MDYLQHPRFETRVVSVAPGARERQPAPQPTLSWEPRYLHLEYVPEEKGVREEEAAPAYARQQPSGFGTQHVGVHPESVVRQ